MKTDTLYNQLKKYTQKFLLVFSCLLALIVGWSGNGINLANAATGGNNIPLIADFDPSGIRNQIEGKTKEIEGRTQKDLGKAESKFDEAAKTANRKADEATAELKKIPKTVSKKVKRL